MNKFHEAVITGNFKVVAHILRQTDEDVDTPDSDGDTALCLAAINGYVDCCRFLLDHRADPNKKGQQGLTPLHLACGRGHIGCVRLLLNRGAKPDEPDDLGRTPLYYCIEGWYPPLRCDQ